MREVGRPACVDPGIWADLEESARGEATARMAWLVVRGLPPIDAFYEALAGMIRDEGNADIEQMPSWDMLRATCEAWSGPARDADGSPRTEVLSLACVADGLVAAGLEHPDHRQDVEDVLTQFCGKPRTVAILARYVHQAIADRTPEPVYEDIPEVAAIPDSAPPPWQYREPEWDAFGHEAFGND